MKLLLIESQNKIYSFLSIAIFMITIAMASSSALAGTYELQHSNAGEQVRPVCFGEAAAAEYSRALHFHMEVLGKSYVDSLNAIAPRTAGKGDLDCYHLRSSAKLRRPERVIDVVETDGLDEWSDMALYAVAAESVTNKDGTVYTRENMGQEVFVVVSDMFVKKNGSAWNTAALADNYMGTDGTMGRTSPAEDGGEIYSPIKRNIDYRGYGEQGTDPQRNRAPDSDLTASGFDTAALDPEALEEYYRKAQAELERAES